MACVGISVYFDKLCQGYPIESILVNVYYCITLVHTYTVLYMLQETFVKGFKVVNICTDLPVMWSYIWITYK